MAIGLRMLTHPSNPRQRSDDERLKGGWCRLANGAIPIGTEIRRLAERPVFGAVEDPAAAWAAHLQDETHG